MKKSIFIVLAILFIIAIVICLYIYNVKKIENIEASETKIKMGNLPSGIYLYSLTNGSKIIESNKLIIK